MTTATASCSMSCATRRCSTPGSAWCPGTPTLDRWTVDLAGGQGHRGADRRHGAGVPARRRADGRHAAQVRLRRRLLPRHGGPVSADTILKHDLAARQTRSVAFGTGREPGEFVFVPSSAGRRRRRRCGDGFRLRPRRRTAVTSCYSTARRWKPSRRCTFRFVCRTVFTATGCRQRDSIGRMSGARYREAASGTGCGTPTWSASASQQ